jgi:hypothetical protein
MIGSAAAGLALLSAVGSQADAADQTLTFGAGEACAFPLQIDSTGGPQVNKTFEGRDGSLRILSAGKGSDLVFTNLADPTHTYALSGNGAASWTRIDASGAARFTVTGHNVLIYFPTDVPAGPSTTLVVGREDVSVDLATSQFTLLSRSGRTVDICAALT